MVRSSILVVFIAYIYIFFFPTSAHISQNHCGSDGSAHEHWVSSMRASALGFCGARMRPLCRNMPFQSVEDEALLLVCYAYSQTRGVSQQALAMVCSERVIFLSRKRLRFRAGKFLSSEYYHIITVTTFNALDNCPRCGRAGAVSASGCCPRCLNSRPPTH